MKNLYKATFDPDNIRRKAERLLNKNPLKIGSPLSESEAMKLIHELEVHQIEMELQNDELLQVKEQAELASQKFSELYEFAPSGYFTLSREGKIIELNINGSQLLGKDRSRLINNSFGLFVSENTRPVFNLFLRNIFSNRTKETCELVLVPGENMLTYVYLTGIITENEEKCMVTAVDITRSKLDEEKLHQSEERYTALFQANHSVMMLINPDTGEIKDANEAACKYYGWSLSEMCSKNISDLNILSNEKVFQKMQKAKREKRNHFFFKHQLANGKRRNVEIFSGPIVFGNVTLLYTIVHDITKRKHAEKALKENERLLRESQSAAHIGSYTTDLIAKTWKISPEIYEIYGIDKSYPHTLDGWIERVHPDFRTELLQDLFHGKAGKSQFEHEYKIIRNNDGVERWVHGLGEIEYDEQLSPVRIFGTVHDITRRKLVEEELMISNKKISESVNDLNRAESIAHLGHWKWNIHTGEIIWSDEMFRIFGIDKYTFSGQLGDVIAKVIHPDDLHLALPSNAENFIRQKPIEYRIILPDHSIRYISAEAGENIVDSDGNPIYITGVAQDITERKQAEKALQQLNEELEDRVMRRTSELLKSNEAIQKAELKYRTVADFAYNWEFWIDQNDEMVYCSPSCERITGYQSSEFIQNSRLIFDIIYPDDLNIYIDHKRKEDTADSCSREIRYRIVRLDGAVRWIGHLCQAIYDDSGNFIGTRGSNKDITGMRKMEQLLKTNNQKYRLLSENITDGIFICKNGCFEFVNKAMYTIFGYSDSKMEGLKLTQLAMPEYVEELENIINLNSLSNQHRTVEIEGLKKDKSTVFVEILFNYVANQRMIYGVVHDITEKKQIHKNNVKAIIQTEEKERANFSKELHDGLGPLLSTIKLYLQWSERPKTNKSREEIIHKAEDILEDALTAVKEISTKLSPHLLMYYGLSAAIQSFVDKLEQTSAIRITFESNASRRLNMEIESALYRAAIECINNTIKHARAKNISIIINDKGNQLQLQYRDDGIGFDVAETISIKKGLGLFNLQNRIQTIGGKITLYSKPGHGVDYQIIVNL